MALVLIHFHPPSTGTQLENLIDTPLIVSGYGFPFDPLLATGALHMALIVVICLSHVLYNITCKISNIITVITPEWTPKVLFSQVFAHFLLLIIPSLFRLLSYKFTPLAFVWMGHTIFVVGFYLLERISVY